MQTTRSSALFMLLFSLTAHGYSDEKSSALGAPTPNIPELQELNRFLGEWEGALGNSDEKIPSKRTWTLDGYFQKHEFAASSGVVRGIIYRGYDNNKHHYTLTFLDSQGNASLLIGNWNAGLKTFVYEAAHRSCPVQKYESYFPDDNTEQWTITFGSDDLTQVTGVAKKLN